MALIEFKDLPDISTPLNASNLNNNFNELKQYNGSLIAMGGIVVASAGTAITSNTIKGFSDIDGSKNSYIKNYVDGILEYSSGTFLIHTQGKVGYIKTTLILSGQTGSGCVGIWFRDNKNALPTGVTTTTGDYSTLGIVSMTANTFGGASNDYNYIVDSNSNLDFFINPSFSPYGGTFTPAMSGTRCILLVEVYSKYE